MLLPEWFCVALGWWWCRFWLEWCSSLEEMTISGALLELKICRGWLSGSESIRFLLEALSRLRGFITPPVYLQELMAISVNGLLSLRWTRGLACLCLHPPPAPLVDAEVGECPTKWSLKLSWLPCLEEEGWWRTVELLEGGALKADGEDECNRL